MLHHKTTPQDVFFQLLGIVTLIITVVSFISLLFQYVNALFPDQIDSYYSFTRSYIVMRTAISSIIVVWPVYLLTMRMIRKQEKKHHKKKDLPMKKWLTYLVLFVAAITIIIDLIALLNNFLGGEMTIHFFLKILTVLVTAGLVFGYYIWELKKGSAQAVLPKYSAIGVSVLLFIVIVAGFFVIGTPKEQRARRFDEQRVENLQSIQWQIINYWNKKGELPKDLSNLKDDINGFVAPLDPLNQQDYKYQIKGDLIFELCADFQTESLIKNNEKVYKPHYDYYNENWNHGVGNTCFEREIDPQLHKTDNDGPEPVIVR